MLHTVYPKDLSGLLGLGINQAINLAEIFDNSTGDLLFTGVSGILTVGE